MTQVLPETKLERALQHATDLLAAYEKRTKGTEKAAEILRQDVRQSLIRASSPTPDPDEPAQEALARVQLGLSTHNRILVEHEQWAYAARRELRRAARQVVEEERRKRGHYGSHRPATQEEIQRGRSLAERRNALGIGQRTLAKEAGLSRGMVCDLEAGRRRSQQSIDRLNDTLTRLIQSPYYR